MNVSIEYSLEPGAGLELHQVQVRVPLGTTAAPEIISAEAGSQSFANGELLWELPLINTNNATGSLEFNLAQSDAESFFPITVTFLSRRLFCDIGVESVSSTQSGLAIAYGSSRMLCVDEQANYIIE
jgi:hypothetical protein